MGGETWEIKNLSELTILFGKNGSGKSVLLRAWRDQSEANVHYVTPERTGEMDYQPQYMREEFTPTSRRNASQRNYMPEYRRRIIGRIQYYFLSRGGYRESGPAPVPPQEIESFINILATDFMVGLVASGPIPYELMRLDGETRISKVDELSSGEAQLVTIALDILTIAAIWEIQNQSQRVLLIDEPDAHIHPDLQVRFSEFIFRVIERFNLQVAIATHSTSLLAALGQFGGQRTGVIYLSRKRQQYMVQRFSNIQKELSACLGGHVLMGPLFGAPILLVEGDDDYRIWSQIPRHHVTNFAVIPSNGEEIKRYQKVLENIFASLRDTNEQPCGYALLDGDVSIPTPNLQTPQNHVRFIQLSCSEAENLYLSDEVLAAMDKDWDMACNLILARADEFGEKAKILAQVKLWDRKNEDVKQVINEVAQILDSKPLNWTVRVGQVLGQKRPEGQIAEFLGLSVVNALWPDNI